MDLVSIVIVTAGSKDYLVSCLDSLNKQSYRKTEIIVIDNSWDNNLIQCICRRCPGINIYRENSKFSYCDSLNFGINKASGDFILCLNDDVVLDERYIEYALGGFFIDPEIGMVSGKILRSNGKILDSTGLFLSPWRTAKERGYGLVDVNRFNVQEYVFGVTGAVAFYRRKMLEDIQEGKDFFDTDFHFFYEDLDVAWRAQRCGWKGYYLPRALAYHVRGGTARDERGIDQPHARRYISDQLLFDLVKNRYLAMIKNELWWGFLLHLPFLLFYEIFNWGYLLFFKPQLIRLVFSNLNYFNSAWVKRIRS